MARSVNKALEWLKKESKTPSKNWGGLCQSAARSSYNMSAFGESAAKAWANVPSRYKHKVTRYDDKSWWSSIPQGAIVYSTNTKHGHAWVCDDPGESAWGTDYVRSGYIDKHPIDCKGWSNVHKAVVGYIVGAHVYKDNDGFFKGLSWDKWDGKIPDHANVVAAMANPELANAAAWRVACKLADDLNKSGWQPVKYVQKFPQKAYLEWCELVDLEPVAYTRVHEVRLFG
jgi:hypothetical protein